MIDISLISAETPLLDEKTAETMRGVFQKLEKAVVLKAVVDLKEEKSAQMASFQGNCRTFSKAFPGAL